MRSWTAWLTGKAWLRGSRPATLYLMTTGCPGCPDRMAGVFHSSSALAQVFPAPAVADPRRIRQIAAYMKRKIR